jgi:ABC-type spermidine/putrescine transport system permease subunit II
MDETYSPPPFPQNDDSNGLSRSAKIGIGVAIVVGVILLILTLAFLLNNPGTTETIRDLFIIVLALESIVVGIILVILIYQLIVLTNMLRDELKPMIDSTQETLNTVRGTATFVSENVTRPAIKASGYISGIGRSIRVLIRMLPRRGS